MTTRIWAPGPKAPGVNEGIVRLSGILQKLFLVGRARSTRGHS